MNDLSSSQLVTSNKPNSKRRPVKKIVIWVLSCLCFLFITLYFLAGTPFILQYAANLLKDAAKEAGFDLNFSKISGNLFSNITLEGSDVKSDILIGQVNKISFNYSVLQLVERKLNLQISLDQGDFIFNPGNFAQQPKTSTAGPIIKLGIDSIKLSRVGLKINGEKLNLPNAIADIANFKTETNTSGSFDLKIATKDGKVMLRSSYWFREDLNDFKLRVQGDVDVNIAKHWYPQLRAGQLKVDYQFTPQGINGQGNIKNGSFEPTPGLILTNIKGWLIQNNDILRAKATGYGLDGPINADFLLDGAQQNWHISGRAHPELAQAAQVFAPGLKATGKTELIVEGGGWEKTKLSGKLQGNGQIVDFPVEKIVADWRFFDDQGLLIDINAKTKLEKEEINLAAQIKAQDKVDINILAQGKVLQKPLKLQAVGQVDAQGQLISKITANILGGKIDLDGNLLANKIKASGNFSNLGLDFAQISGDLDLTGPIDNLQITGQLKTNSNLPVQQKLDGPFNLLLTANGIEGKANLGPLIWQGDLQKGDVKLINAKLKPLGIANFDGKYAVNSGKFALMGDLGLKDIKNADISLSDLNGNFKLQVDDQISAEWRTRNLQAILQNNKINLDFNKLSAKIADENLFLAGNLGLNLPTNDLFGQIKLDSRFGKLQGKLTDKNLGIKGQLNYQKVKAELSGDLNLDDLSFSVQAKADNSPLKIQAHGSIRDDLVANGAIDSGKNRSTSFNFAKGQLQADGKFDLAAIDPFLPSELQNKVLGLADISFKDQLLTANIDGKFDQWPVKADLFLENGVLKTKVSSIGGPLSEISLDGQLFPTVNVRASWDNLTAEANGDLENLNIKLNGQLPSLLRNELTQAKLDLANKNINIEATLHNDQFTATGIVAGLNLKAYLNQGIFKANLSGDTRFSLNQENWSINGIQANFSQQNKNTFALKWLVNSANGTLSGSNINAKTINGTFLLKNGQINDIPFKYKTINLNSNGQSVQSISGDGNFNLENNRFKLYSSEAKLANILQTQKIDLNGQILSDTINFDLKAKRLALNFDEQSLIKSNFSAHGSSVGSQISVKSDLSGLEFRSQEQNFLAKKLSVIAEVGFIGKQTKISLVSQNPVVNSGGNTLNLADLKANLLLDQGKTTANASISSFRAKISDNLLNGKELDVKWELSQNNHNFQLDSQDLLLSNQKQSLAKLAKANVILDINTKNQLSGRFKAEKPTGKVENYLLNSDFVSGNIKGDFSSPIFDFISHNLQASDRNNRFQMDNLTGSVSFLGQSLDLKTSSNGLNFKFDEYNGLLKTITATVKLNLTDPNSLLTMGNFDFGKLELKSTGFSLDSDHIKAEVGQKNKTLNFVFKADDPKLKIDETVVGAKIWQSQGNVVDNKITSQNNIDNFATKLTNGQFSSQKISPDIVIDLKSGNIDGKISPILATGQISGQEINLDQLNGRLFGSINHLQAELKAKTLDLNSKDYQGKLKNISSKLDFNNSGLNSLINSAEGQLLVQNIPAKLADLEVNFKANNQSSFLVINKGQIKIEQTDVFATLGRLKGQINLNGDPSGWITSDLVGSIKSETYQGQAKATIGQDFVFNADIIGKNWHFRADGPPDNLKINGNLPTELSKLAKIELPIALSGRLDVQGTLDLINNRNDLNVQGQLKDYKIFASLKESIENPSIRASITGHGQAEIIYHNKNWQLRAQKLDLQPILSTQLELNAELASDEAINGQANGNLAGFTFNANWKNGKFVANLADFQLSSNNWRFPIDVEPISIHGGPSWISANGQFDLKKMSADVDLRFKGFDLLTSSLIPISLEPFDAKLDFANGNLKLSSPQGELDLINNQLQGQIRLDYILNQQRGRIETNLAGSIDQPVINLSSSGPVKLRANTNLDQIKLQGTLQLADLSKDFAGEVALKAEGKLSPINLSLAALTNNAKFKDKELVLNSQAKIDGNKWQANAELVQNRSVSHFQGNENGFIADFDLNLELLSLFGIEASGKAIGQAKVSGSNWSLEQAQGILELQEAKIAGIETKGMFKLDNGKLNSNVSGTLFEKPLNINGQLYPKINLSLQFDQLKGLINGDINNLDINLSGQFLEKKSKIDGSLRDGQFKIAAQFGKSNLNAQGALNGPGKGQISLDLTDFSLPGRLSTDLEIAGTKITASSIQGNLEGFAIKGQAVFDQALKTDISLVEKDISAEINGEIWPKLALDLKANSKLKEAKFRLTGKTSGTLANPQAELAGQIEEALLGAGTTIKASLNQQKLRADFTGPIEGTILGRLDAKQIIENVNLQLNTALKLEQNWPIDGQITWDKDQGFTSNLKTQWLGKTGRLIIVGSDGRIDLNGNLIELSNLPKEFNLPEKLDIAIKSVHFDTEKLFGDKLFSQGKVIANGLGRISGSLTEPKISLGGQIKGDLSADFSIDFDKYLRAELIGQGISAQAQLDSQNDWQLKAKLDQFDLPNWLLPQVKDLKISSNLNGESKNGQIKFQINQLNLEGQSDYGDIDLIGQAELGDDQFKADLSGHFADNSVVLQGTLGKQLALNLKADEIKLKPFGFDGSISANALFTGTLDNPLVKGKIETLDLKVGNNQINGIAEIEGPLLQPKVAAKIQSTGEINGKISLNGNAIELFDPLKSNWQVSASGEINKIDIDADLNGIWPRLEGEIKVRQQDWLKAQITGLGNGTYSIDADNIAKGNIQISPDNFALTGDLAVKSNLKSFLPELSGSIDGLISVSGSVFAPTATATAEVAPNWQGLTTPKIQFDAKLSDKLTAEATYLGGKAIFDGQDFKIDDLPINYGQINAKLSGQGNFEQAIFKATLDSLLKGQIDGVYRPDQINLKTDLNVPSLDIKASAQAELKDNQWNGVIKAERGEINVETRLTGAVDNPKFDGSAEFFGAKADIRAQLSPISLVLGLKDGKNAKASGQITLQDDKISGQAHYQLNDLFVDLIPSGTLTTPAVSAKAKFGQLTADLQGSLHDGTPQATLKVMKDKPLGQFDLKDDLIKGNLSLNLRDLLQENISGQLDLTANLRLSDLNGSLEANFSQIKTPFTVPMLNWPIDGSGRATYKRGAEQTIEFSYQGSIGQAQGRLSNERMRELNEQLNSQQGWHGQVDLDLGGSEQNGPQAKGRIEIKDGFFGKIEVKRFPLQFEGVSSQADGQLELLGDKFRITAKSELLSGSVNLDGQGTLADLLPELENFGLKPGNGYQLRARLAGIRTDQYPPLKKLLPGLSGRVSGLLQLSNGLSTFQISAPNIKLGDEALPVRLEGSLAWPEFSYSGTIAGSFFNGRFDGQNLAGRLEMRHLAVHSVLESLVGQLPGTGFLTGLVRYDIPLKNPLDGTIRLAVERADLQAGEDSLRGGGTIEFAKRTINVEGFNLQSNSASGSGSWQASGRYGPGDVDLRLKIDNAVFTPILRLIPALRDLTPAAQGNVNLVVSGEYGNPTLEFTLDHFKAELAGLDFTLPQLNMLLNEKHFSVAGDIESKTLGGQLSVLGSAELEGTNIKNIDVTTEGQLNLPVIGSIDQLQGKLSGAINDLNVNLTSPKLDVKGKIRPLLDLSFSARNLALSAPEVLVREGTASAEMTLRQEPGELVIGGNVDISRLILASVEDKTAKSAEVASSNKPATSSRNPVLQRLRFAAVRINAPNNVRLQENIAKAELGGNLTLTGTAATPELSGLIRAVGQNPDDRGTIALGPNVFTIRTAEARFNPADGLLPQVVAQGVARVRTQVSDPSTKRLISGTVLVTLEANVRFFRNGLGDIRIEPSFKLSGEAVEGELRQVLPSLSEAQLYSLITLGTFDNLSISGLGQGALNSALNLFLISEINKAVNQATGLDFSFSTNLLDINDKDRKISAAFSIGGYLTRQIYLEYRFDTLGDTFFNLSFTTDDGKFSLRFSSPLQIRIANQTSPLFSGFAPEFTASYNFSNNFSLSGGIKFSTGISVKLGLDLRF